MIDERRLVTLNNLLVRYPHQKSLIVDSLNFLIGSRIKAYVEQAFLSAPVEELEAMVKHIETPPVTTPVVESTINTTPVVGSTIPPAIAEGTPKDNNEPPKSVEDATARELGRTVDAVKKVNGKANGRARQSSINKKHDKVGKDLLE